MRLLIDTHLVIWADEQPLAIIPKLRAAMLDPANDIFVSVASVWEIAIKRAAGKLRLDRPIVEAVALLGFERRPITGTHAEHAGRLPLHHRDPFDRMLIAQAMLEGIVLGTQDAMAKPCGIPTLGLDR